MEQITQTPKLPNLIKGQDTFKMIIPDKVERKIRSICQQVWNVEWSGILFYTYKGSFEEGSLEIICQDIYPMDIGSSGYTEFNMSPDVARYMVENPELINCQQSLIHSHCTFSTFFSGTDLQTLRLEGNDRNHFVSLIVNNEGTYTAAITRKLEGKKNVTIDYQYNTFGNKSISGTNQYSEDYEELEWFNLEIIFENNDNSIRNEIKDRLNEIKQNKAKLAKSTNYPWISNNPISNNPYIHSDNTPLFKGTHNQHTQTSLPFADNIDYDFIDCKDCKDSAYFTSSRQDMNKETIKSLLYQLVTGSILAGFNSKLDIDKWAKGMVPLYEKRFGKGELGLFTFKMWAESLIEFLCYFTEAKELVDLGYNEDIIASSIAEGLIEELNKLPKNVYITEFINILNNYLL